MTSDSIDQGDVAIAFCKLLEMIGTAALLLDRRGFVIAANELIRGSLGNDLQIVNARLTSPDTGANAAVNKLVKCIVNGEQPSPPRAVSIRRINDLPMVVYGFRLSIPALEAFDPARAILLLVDPRSRPLPSELQLKDAFDLSWMEAKLTLCLARGDALDTAAATCGTTYESARSLIKSAYRKTGTHRQAELVALIYSIAHVPLPVTGLADSAAFCALANHQTGPDGR